MTLLYKVILKINDLKTFKKGLSLHEIYLVAYSKEDIE